MKELCRIAHELEVDGYSLSSFANLGLRFDTKLAEELCSRVNQSEGSAPALEVVKHIDKDMMTIVQEERCMELGRLVLKPVVETLFADRESIAEDWTLFGINRYEKGGRFGAHRDAVGATVFVITVSGIRKFNVFETKPEATQAELRDIERSFELSPGSVMILDGVKDPGHAVSEVKEASIVAIADVPYILRANEEGQVSSHILKATSS